jgi:regulatory protein
MAVPSDRPPDFEKALGLALKRLRLSDKLEAELLKALVMGGFSTETATFVLSFLKDRKLISDRRTIENHIEKRSGRRSIGQEKIRAELLERGAPEELVEECLANADVGDEAGRAVQALRAKYAQEVERGKAGRFLASRGFGEELIETALDRFFESNDRA